MHFIELIDLAAERLGGAVLGASDEFFQMTGGALTIAPAFPTYHRHELHRPLADVICG